MIEIVKPSKGEVTLTLPYEEAEVLCRAVGMVNAGNLRTHAPVLNKAMDELLQVFGRNVANEVHDYTATITSGQVYIADVREF